MDNRIADFGAGKWRVHFVLPGDAYGMTGSLTYEVEEAETYGGGLPLVEFFDMSAEMAKFPEGQFVARYYLKSLLGLGKWDTDLRDMAARGIGFSLQGDIPAWTICSEELAFVADMLWDAYRSLR